MQNSNAYVYMIAGIELWHRIRILSLRILATFPMACMADLYLKAETNQNYRADLIIDWKSGLRLDSRACTISKITTIQ